MKRDAKTIVVLLALVLAQFADAGIEADSTLRLDVNEKTLALQKTAVEQSTRPNQAAQSQQSDTTEPAPKAATSYEADLMRRMGFAEKEIARDAEREHNWRIEHEKAQAQYIQAQQQEFAQYLRQRARGNPAYATALRLYQGARSLQAQGDTDKANKLLERANQILAAQQNFERDKAIADDINKFVRQQQQAAAHAKQRMEKDTALAEEAAEADEDDQKSYRELSRRVEEAQFSPNSAVSIDTFGIQNTHESPTSLKIDSLERQIDDAKFFHEPASAIHP